MKPDILRTYDETEAEPDMGTRHTAQIYSFTHHQPHHSVSPDVIKSHHGYFAWKRCVDLGGACTLLVMLAPLLLSIALAVKLTSRGPVFFRQRRYGKANQLFVIFKFRTMRVDAQDLSGVQQACKDDPRLTPIGGFLRRSSLDELPQIFNVIWGDMSLVGPRPHVPGMLAGGMLYERLVPYYFQRHAVKPGITGWAQIHGLRGPTTDAILATQRIAYDLDYIAKLSLKRDLVILWKTLWSELFARNGT